MIDPLYSIRTRHSKSLPLLAAELTGTKLHWTLGFIYIVWWSFGEPIDRLKQFM
uniref:Hypotheticial protein n=1 Tax=Schistosoma japonicum TaxID=6182 RepID=C1LDD0_SCHJA|nr:hypotheticial protein [Schistosoma japonicum]